MCAERDGRPAHHRSRDFGTFFMHSALPSVANLEARSTPRLSHGALFWVLQFGGWAAYGGAIAVNTFKLEPPAAVIVDTFFFVLSGFAVSCGFRYVFRILRRRSPSLPYIGIGIFLAALFGVPVMWELCAFFTHACAHYYPTLGVIITSYTQFSFNDWLGWSYSLIGWSFLYFGINSWISLQAVHRRAYIAEAAAQEARALVLQAQLQPHFLFNALNSVSALILDHKGQKAAQMIADLGSLLRMSMQSADSPLIPLTRELEFIRQYLELERMRFGERLNYRFDVSTAAANALVPTLLLQPLVENSLRHGILPQRVGGLVTISGAVEDGKVRLKVADNGRGWQSQSPDQPGIGLANTARRLKELFGPLGQLEIIRGAGGVTVDISLPYEAFAAMAKHGTLEAP